MAEAPEWLRRSRSGWTWDGSRDTPHPLPARRTDGAQWFDHS